MAPFEEMSAAEKEEFIISLAVLVCADAKIEITVRSQFHTYKANSVEGKPRQAC